MTPDTANHEETRYICIGICQADPDSGYCQGCGRPPMESPTVVAEVVPVIPSPRSITGDSDGPE